MQVKKFDGFAALSLFLAFFIMVWPIEADIIDALLRQDGQPFLACLVALECFVVVLVPYAISLRRHWCYPGKRRGWGYLAATTLILSLNTVLFGTVFIRQVVR
ncbi:hypothetical protein BH10PLA2_BH10PLA2_14100 [soil metagenome]